MQEIKAVQARTLVRLAFSEGGKVARQGDLKPKLLPRDRQELVQAKLLEVSKGSKGAKSLELTEHGWRWISDNLSHPMPRGSELLGDVLGYLDRFLKANHAALSDVVSAHKIQALETTPPDSTGDAKQLVLQASLALNDGRPNERVRLSDLRARLAHLSRDTVDRALFALQDEGAIVLYPLDYAPAITAGDEGACVRVGGEARHILYVRR